jgi:hypothetical protein
MKKFSKKGVLLFAAAMALCAFVMPSVASAASWGVIGTEHTLDSPDVGFTSANAGGITSQCTSSSFTVDVRSAADLTITAARFGGLCTASGPGIGVCTATSQPTRLPWTATAITSTLIEIHGIHIDTTFEQTPGGLCAAAAVGTKLTITGTLTNADWDPVEHAVRLNNAHGLVSHSVLGAASPIAATGTFRDTAQTLTVSP